ncbi:chromosome partitioning protein ParA [Roseomonas sp. M0104]|uniref:Chromosome partitioning protein ParA n=1 Tax=Teichococcus coralli TaxID=2545983 RepID=A0A845BJR8_9PROT|nr:AAA family ATPase [Pseudoroseomonas coralli]MXP65537.1 chromosome partitioning protein ParA [Pseudoroseomonas coralli]
MDGEALRMLRQQLRQSQSELKDALNRALGRSYDKPRISRWENGREPIPEEVARAMQALASGQPRHARILVLANQKGGVGKTTSALNLACGLARQGRRVLLADLDPQATASVALMAGNTVEAYRQGRTMAQVILRDLPLEQAIFDRADPLLVGRGGFDLVPSHIDLAETDGRREPGFDVALREALEAVRDRYDIVVLDAPPNLGMLTVMGLAAADEVIIPVRTEPYDSMGVGLILATIGKVQRRLNPALRLGGILPTQFGPRKSVDREVLEQLVGVMAGKAPVLEPVPASAVFGHAARNGRIALEASSSTAAVAVYGRLAAALAAGQPLPQAELLAPAEEG